MLIIEYKKDKNRQYNIIANCDNFSDNQTSPEIPNDDSPTEGGTLEQVLLWWVTSGTRSRGTRLGISSECGGPAVELEHTDPSRGNPGGCSEQSSF